jgi:methylase of polypeptide subunit release factors
VPLTIDQLEEIVAELLQRPKHEKVRVLVSKLLTDGLGAQSADLTFEEHTIEVRGRIDALLGRTVIEFKSDLRREDFEKQLAGYLKDKKSQTGRDFVGIVTDGALFGAYELSKDEEGLELLREYKPTVDNPRGLLTWLESVVALQDKLSPEVERIKQELGRESVLYPRALRELHRLWDEVGSHPEVQVKRQLWDRLLRVAYGSDVEAPELFLQHTYLVIVAKAVATAAFVDHLPDNGRDLLDGKEFKDLGISGAVEADFFDWLLTASGGDALVLKIARQAARFDLSQIEADVLKGLYESLIDPAQRHELGEYYTPDWLAAWVVEEAVTKPLDQRVIDPACGSGTFLFHSIRHLAAAGKGRGLSPVAIIELAEEKIAGIDVHPVAVIFARATWLLALLPTLESGRPPSLSIPVYLGDALQWNARELMGVHELEILVPPKLPSDDPSLLRFPENVVVNPTQFDAVLATMLDLAERNREGDDFSNWLSANAIGSDDERKMLTGTYETLRKLNAEGRNHIWGYVARNLSRPIWLATDRQKADVVIGNPPWVDYRRMGRGTQERFRKEMIAAGLWEKKVHGSAFDLSSYFFARSVHLYMKRDGHIAFVLPYAAMTRRAYQQFRRGSFKVGGFTETVVRFTDAWAFPSDVAPLFPVPSCVLFAVRSKLISPLPSKVTEYSGHLPRRDASPREAEAALSSSFVPWPRAQGDVDTASKYKERFKAGAKLDPRRLMLVEFVQGGRLGQNPDVPLVVGRTGTLDKEPWKSVSPPEAAVEKRFIRPVYLGESIGPYRLFGHVYGVIPYDTDATDVLTSDAALARGFGKLANWLGKAEDLWNKYGKGSSTFAEKFDFYGLLSVQFPLAKLRVVYSKSGSNPAAAIIEDERAIIDHKLYWMACKSRDEAEYLCAIFNSETARARAEQWQSEGQWGKRDFDKALLNLPIPEFDPKNELHKELAAAAMHAEFVASRVEVKEGEYFVTTRNRIRKTLAEEGIAEDIDKLVEKLLGPV